MARFMKQKQMPCMLGTIKDSNIKLKQRQTWVLTSQLAAVFIPLSKLRLILLKESHQI